MARAAGPALLGRRALVGAAIASLALGCRREGRPLRVLARAVDLRQLPFWVAMGGGVFAELELPIEHVVMRHPGEAGPALGEGRVDAAVLDAETLLGLVARGAPLRLVARLWARETAAVVVHRRIVEADPVSDSAALGLRAERLTGLRLAVAPALEARFAALWTDTGLPLAARPAILRVAPERQNLALARGDVDGMFAASPQLEHAIVRQAARILIAPSRGTVPSLAATEATSLVVTREAIARRPHDVARLVAGQAEALRWLRRWPQVAVSAALEVVPDRLPREVEALVLSSRGAVPETTMPSVAGLMTSAGLVAVDGPTPTRRQVAAAIEPRFAIAADRGKVDHGRVYIPAAFAAAGAVLGWWLRSAKHR